ncbi:MAG: hypothetical protein HKP34_07010 [Nitrosopumilus sp.]|nr:hypothetical protein [Nitrosopumilus sp.]NNL38035.1 hypothetical protein [Nitrosopumilus sp.]
MSAVNNQSRNQSNKKSIFIIAGVILVGAVLLLSYLMWYVSPEEYIERVKVIAITDEGCIAETFDGYAVNIGNCKVQQGEYVNAVIDKKVKERAAAMNPTS